ncbi:hypothetical protein NM680_06130 [Paracoccus sp. PS-1]|uniref:hypothetical protein n=1 Tax=unclassified Paracoccus (in: a-proteobacteria) TaxID=2688777 RepID=UPI00048D5FF4|nr:MULTISPECIES: hypothetical protein [unclassified Paracoccus (in: a-proteobacteria)]MDQ7261379.1 hypothetical protein [Paracoccus sp. PS1]
MTGKKTRQQQRQIIEKRVDTSNAGKDFDSRPYLEAAKHPQGQITEGRVRPQDLENDDGDPSPKGENQESQHHKRDGRPEDEG